MHALILISFLFVVLKLAVFVFFVPNQPLPTCMFLFCPIVFVASFCVVCFACQLCVDAAWFMVLNVFNDIFCSQCSRSQCPACGKRKKQSCML